MQSRNTAIGGTLALLALAGVTAAGTLPSYSLSVAIIPGEGGLSDNISITNETPAINNDLTVALPLLEFGQFDDQVFISSGGSGTIVRSTPGSIGELGINEDDDLSWREFFSSPDGVYMYDAAAMASMIVTTGPLGTSSFSSPGIDELDRIGYRASFTGGGQVYALYDAGTIDILAANDTADINSPYTFLYTPSQSDNGQIAGKVDISTPGNDVSEIRIFNNDSTSTLIAETTGANPASPYGSFDNSVDIDNNGRVVFTARDLNGDLNDDGVFVSDGTTTTQIATLADNGAQISDIQFFAPRLSNAGIAAFIADDENGEEAVFIGDGTSLVKLLGTGTPVATDSGTKFVEVDSISGNLGINDNGDVAINCRVLNADNSLFDRVIVVARIDEQVNDCQFDFNNDGIVDGADFGDFGAAFGSMTGDANYSEQADSNDDGVVDGADFGDFGAEFGRTDCLP